MANEYKLSEEIIALSVANTWDKARLEWIIEELYWEEEPDTCLCGQFPINDMCYLRNTKNGNRALVGNVCVKKFEHLPSGKMFDAIKRVAKDETKSLNPEAIEHAYTKQWINTWEHNFYFDTWRKKNLSDRQLSTRIKINRVVLNRVRNAR